MNAKVKKLLFRLGALVVLLAVAAVMMVIGRGHTVYLDNKTLEHDGTEYKAYYKIEVSTKNMDKTAKLMARDRGMSTWIGQDFHMDLLVTEKEGDEPKSLEVSLSLPYGMDNPVINLPALLAGEKADVWLDEFIPTPSTEDLTDDVDLGDPFGGGMDAELPEDGELPDTGSDIMG